MLTEGEEGGVGDASLNAGETCGGVEQISEALNGAASSESPEEGNSHVCQCDVRDGSGRYAKSQTSTNILLA